MRNIDRFDEYAAVVLARLYEQFPIKADLHARRICGSDDCEPREAACATVEWLAEAGYLRMSESTPGGAFRGCALTDKGLKLLRTPVAAVPQRPAASEPATQTEEGMPERKERPGPADALDVRHGMLLFAARRMVRYHRHREHFLDRARDAAALLTAFSGSATAAAALAAASWALPWAALATALLSACELAFQTARRARLHAGLARDWGAFERDVRRVRLQLTEEALIDLQARRLEIEAHEPPPLRVLDAMCHDEVVTAMGLSDAQRSNVTPLQRLLRNVADFRADRIRKRMDAR